MYENAWKSPNSIKSIVTALLQFGSRSITMTHFLQKLLSCNKLCAIIVADRHDKLFSRSYLDFRACCDMLFMEAYAVCWIFFTRKCLDALHNSSDNFDGRSHAVSVAFLLHVCRACTVYAQQCESEYDYYWSSQLIHCHSTSILLFSYIKHRFPLLLNISISSPRRYNTAKCMTTLWPRTVTVYTCPVAVV